MLRLDAESIGDIGFGLDLGVAKLTLPVTASLNAPSRNSNLLIRNISEVTLTVCQVK